MALTSKTSREAILAEAVRIVEEEGRAALSLRSLARSLSLATNALYHYFTDRGALETAVALEGWRRLLDSMSRAVARRAAVPPFEAASLAYIRFARKHAAIYSLMTTTSPEWEKHQDLYEGYRELNRRIYESVVAAAQIEDVPYYAWGFLHGLVLLDAHGLLPGRKSEADAVAAIGAMVRGLGQAPASAPRT